MEDKNKMYAKIFKAFCDEKRLAILDLLGTGEKCACVLIDEMGIGQSALSYHMKILCESGVVESRQDGKWTHYSISKYGSQKAIEILKEITKADNFQTEDICSCLK